MMHTNMFKLLMIWHTILVCHAANDLSIIRPLVVVPKCCPKEELLNENIDCQNVNITDSMQWEPLFFDQRLKPNAQHQEFTPVYGLPDCGSQLPQPVFEMATSYERLFLLQNGKLRHYYHYIEPDEDDHKVVAVNQSYPHREPLYYDYDVGSYCLDKALQHVDGRLQELQAAIICVPTITTPWSTDLVMRRIVNPVLHIFGIACLLTVAIIYFVFPPLRDLVGNILSTISVCLIVSQIADLVCIFTELTNHVSFLVADVIMYLSLLAAFFWLNSLGYYIWKIFRSRNVFLRVSDGRKYCYYSSYAWGATLLMTFVALASHFLFDVGSSIRVSPHNQRTIGWLGIAMFFTPIACTILVDLFFYLTTARAISRMATYGRIHGRMKFSFQLFIQMFLVMSTAWFFLLMSWLKYDALVFLHMIFNALQPPLILLICVVGRKNVRSLLKKGCCRGENDPQWGEEMMSMTSN